MRTASATPSLQLRPLLVWPLLVLASVTMVTVLGHVLPPSAALAPAFVLGLALPGYALLRTAGLDEAFGVAGTLGTVAPAGLAAWIAVLVPAMLLHVPPELAGAAVIVGATILLCVRGPRLEELRTDWREPGILLAVSAGFAALASRFEHHLSGDALFHAGRVRKLVEIPQLSFSGISTYDNGPPHAGYVVPALHAVDAFAVSLTGLDPSDAYPHLAAAAAFFVPLTFYALGRLAGGRTIGAAVLVLALWDITARPGAAIYTIQQPTTFTFLVLVPATISVVVAWMRFPDERARVIAVVSAVAVVAVVHATYAVVPLSALAATVVLRRRGWITLAAAAGVTGLIWSAIWFVALRGGHHLDRPPATNEFVKAGNTVVMLTGETVVNGRFYAWLGIVALIPLLVLFQRRNTWIGAMVLGPVALVALPGLATLMVAVLGPGQTKRMWNGIPWSLSLAVLVAELAVAFRGLRLAACAAAVAAAGIAYEQLGMRWLASSAVISGVAVAGTVIVLVLALRRTPIRIDTRHVVSPLPVTALIAAVLAGPVIADAGRVGDVVANGPAKVEGHYRPRVPAQVIDYFRAHDSWRFPVVLAEPYIAYQLAGQSTVYAFAVPEERSRAEPKVAAGLRRDLASQFLSPATRPDVRGKVMDRYRVSYVVTNAAALRKSETAMSREPGLHRVLHVGSWSVYARR